MLSKKMLTDINAETYGYWKKAAKDLGIIAVAQGKEMGHKLADLVDEKTTALLTLNHIIMFQRKNNGDKRSRSMGDLWLREGDVYHPINVKTGIVGLEGQPNLVSLKKTLSALMDLQIDSYYLLFVKLQVDNHAIIPFVYLVDMLDWLDYVTYDSGPGQIMLKGHKLFDDYNTYQPKKLSTLEKVERLMELYGDGERRLMENRQRDRQDYAARFKAYQARGDFAVTQATQASLDLA